MPALVQCHSTTRSTWISRKEIRLVTTPKTLYRSLMIAGRPSTAEMEPTAEPTGEVHYRSLVAMNRYSGHGQLECPIQLGTKFTSAALLTRRPHDAPQALRGFTERLPRSFARRPTDTARRNSAVTSTPTANSITPRPLVSSTYRTQYRSGAGAR